MKKRSITKIIIIGVCLYLLFIAIIFAIMNIPNIYNCWIDYQYPTIIQNNNLKIQCNDSEIRLQLNQPYENFGEEWFVSPDAQSDEIIDLNNIFVNTSGNYRVLKFNNNVNEISCSYIKPEYYNNNSFEKRYSHYTFTIKNNEIIQK